MDRRSYLSVAGTTVAVGMAGCLGASSQPTGDYDVGMTIDSFRPDRLEVSPGTTVEFRNTSSHSHTVTAFQDGYPDEAAFWSSGNFDSEAEAVDAWNSPSQGGRLTQNDSYEHTFEIEGVYSYYCIPHIRAEMTGTVVVE